MASILPFLGPIISGGAAALGGLFGKKENQETKTQKKQRELVDQLIGSLNGQGPYASLFNANPEDFERSFAGPARARFKNQTAPQIQQSYIAGGQQRSTGLEDTLARAGVDMEQLLNEHYQNYQQGAQNRSANAIGNILGQGAGAPNAQSGANAATQGLGGYLSGQGFGSDLEGILSSFGQPKKPPGADSLIDTFAPPRKGFERDQATYNPYTGVQQ
jgi:hypothetical protein